MNISTYFILAEALLFLTLGIFPWDIQHPAKTRGIPVDHSNGMYSDKMNQVSGSAIP